MAAHAQSQQRDTERQAIESLRARYESDGFAFTSEPGTDKLPDFLGSYRPDALAQKPGHNVAIEVRQRRSPPTERKLTEIRHLFDGQSDWQFHVVFPGSDPLQELTIPVAEPATVRTRMTEVRTLVAQGHRRAAFVTAWSLLEAAFRSVDGEPKGRPYTPGTVVQTLAMNGLIEPETEVQMRGLVELRNRIVHGDLAAEPTTADVDLVLSAIEQSLSASTA